MEFTENWLLWSYIFLQGLQLETLEPSPNSKFPATQFRVSQIRDAYTDQIY